MTVPTACIVLGSSPCNAEVLTKVSILPTTAQGNNYEVEMKSHDSENMFTFAHITTLNNPILCGRLNCSSEFHKRGKVFKLFLVPLGIHHQIPLNSCVFLLWAKLQYNQQHSGTDRALRTYWPTDTNADHRVTLKTLEAVILFYCSPTNMDIQGQSMFLSMRGFLAINIRQTHLRKDNSLYLLLCT